MGTYHWLRIKAPERTWTTAYERLRAHGLGEARLWGAFHGLFGIGSDELVLVTHGEAAPVAAVTEAGFAVVAEHAFAPTVRPQAFTPVERPGLYVHRFFDVANDDVDEIARLSEEAWTTFEAADAYAAEPQALFCQADRSAPWGVMLLVTWYDGLDSWQTSRAPAPEAAENFRRRRELTRGTVAYATRLVENRR